MDDLIKKLLPKPYRKRLKRLLKKKNIGRAVKILFREFGLTVLEYNGLDDGRRTFQNRSNKSGVSLSADSLQRDLAQARLYQQHISDMVPSLTAGSKEQVRLTELSDQLNEWVVALEALIDRMPNQAEDALLAAEKKRIPAAIKRLQKQLAAADDPVLRQKLAKTLVLREEQLANLEQTVNRQRMIGLKMEQSIARLGIIYAQIRNDKIIYDKLSYNRVTDEIAMEVHNLYDSLMVPDEPQLEGLL